MTNASKVAPSRGRKQDKRVARSALGPRTKAALLPPAGTSAKGGNAREALMLAPVRERSAAPGDMRTRVAGVAGGRGNARSADTAAAAPVAGDAAPTIRPNDVLRRLASLKTMEATELKAQWRKLFDNEPPAYNRRFLESRLAYRIQELAYGGFSPETVRKLEQLGEELDGGNISVRRRTAAMNRPIAGTRLIREWRGVEHCVTVLADGFEWQGRPYQSLSAIANAITGTRWNGLVFFGLKNQRGRS